MITCWKCGEALEEDDDPFCVECGAKQADAPDVTDDDDAPAVEAASAPPDVDAVEPEAPVSPDPPPAEVREAPAPPPAAETAPEELETAVGTAVLDAEEPVPHVAPSPLIVDPVEPIGAQALGSVRDAVAARQLLWEQIDGAQALLVSIEAAAKPAAGTVAGSVEAHARLTTGRDLLAELRSIQSEVGTEVQVIGERAVTIAAHEAEIARLNRNRMIMIVSGIVGGLLFLIIIASAL